ncbi:Histone-lysine N-methyltransferase [Nesidiocoris tenuis]|uniref:Histone-lysine N-methyltransferase n=1 Tax=Nesidiocoris tenuis TaxID=355587 RepID=A0ABN7B039_9HEMI|nr:Histone-lysine N-methyltransferase [Nesidiocoris tenuis]
MRAGRSISTEQCGVSAPLKPTSTVCLSRKRPDPAQCLKPITPILKYYRRPAGLHHCDRSCAVPVDVILKLDPKLGPLIRPLFLGFKREPGGALGVTYTAPCGQKISNFDQLLTFLNQTMVHLSVTNFDFTPEINPKRIFDPDPEFVFAKMDDISEGLEDGGISVVNEYDSDLPDAFIYQNHRVFAGGRGVDTDFVSGCSCEDNCQNLLTCECASLTVESYLSWNCHSTTTLEPQQIGYQHKRLLNEIPTGIYECNKRCKCGPNCPRRLVQHPSEVKFQLFSTRGKGWGVRTLYDVPKGMMVSVYLGTILNEFDAERWGSVYGDAYLTDLDFIYKAESRKPDYEDCPVDVNDNAAVKKDDTEPGTPQKTKAGRTVRERVVIQKKKKYKLKNNGRSRRVKSLRRFFPKGEAEFTIDAKLSGNISKYFNHSCNPNMFVQNVFVDTHDPRLPWVAFFTKNNIVAGTELTWDYDYFKPKNGPVRVPLVASQSSSCC